MGGPLRGSFALQLDPPVCEACPPVYLPAGCLALDPRPQQGRPGHGVQRPAAGASPHAAAGATAVEARHGAATAAPRRLRAGRQAGAAAAPGRPSTAGEHGAGDKERAHPGRQCARGVGLAEPRGGGNG